MRGKAGNHGEDDPFRGITPAYAGKSLQPETGFQI